MPGSWKLKHFKTDPQREALYKAEKEFIPKFYWRGGMTVEQVLRLIKRVRRQYRLCPISFKTVSHLNGSEDGGWAETTFTAEGKVKSACITHLRDKNPIHTGDVLHELAHVVVDCHFDPEPQMHGPEFVGVCLWLYTHYRVIPEDAFRLVLRRYKVKHKSMAESSPAAIKRLP